MGNQVDDAVYMYCISICIIEGTESSIPVGVIDMTVSIIPQCDTLAEEVLTEQTKLEKNHQAERNRLFLVYTKQWWREYLQIRSSHNNRLVKLYAQVCLYPALHPHLKVADFI